MVALGLWWPCGTRESRGLPMVPLGLCYKKDSGTVVVLVHGARRIVLRTWDLI